MKKLRLALIVILVLSCFTTVYASDWTGNPFNTDVENKQWDRNNDGVLDERELSIKEALESREDIDESVGSDEAVTTIVANRAAYVLNTVCYLTGSILMVIAVTSIIVYMADYVSDGRWEILSRITKTRISYAETNIVSYTIKALFVAVLGVIFVNGSFQRALYNMYMYILQYVR